jgi:DNA topoisomerase VI subunit B
MSLATFLGVAQRHPQFSRSMPEHEYERNLYNFLAKNATEFKDHATKVLLEDASFREEWKIYENFHGIETDKYHKKFRNLISEYIDYTLDYGYTLLRSPELMDVSFEEQSNNPKLRNIRNKHLKKHIKALQTMQSKNPENHPVTETNAAVIECVLHKVFDQKSPLLNDFAMSKGVRLDTHTSNLSPECVRECSIS